LASEVADKNWWNTHF